MRALAFLLLIAACNPKSEGETRQPARTQRERDSVLGASRIPGATGIRRALGASDSADARNVRIDSAGAEP